MSSPWDYEKPNVKPGHWLTTQMLQEWWDTETRIGQLRRITWKERDELSVLSLVVVANLPQLAITTAYYFYSGISTTILAAAEYSSYGATQMPLRVSSPVESSEQISEYFLNMPYRYGIPMNLLSIALHWLVSKSLYYVSIIPYGPGGQSGDSNGRKFITETDYYSSYHSDLAYASSLVYSPFFIFVSLLVLGLMVCILLVLSFRRLNSEIPITRSCSAVISAACHPPKHEDCESAILGKLKWGETTQPAWDLDWFDVTIEDGKGHCSFSSWHVENPSFQKMYA